MESKKRKRESKKATESEVDTSKPTVVFEPKEGRAYTLSIALPGSIIENAQTHELQTLLVGQIARAVAVFCVDEVVVFDDGQTGASKFQEHGSQRDSYTGYSDPNFFLAHILAYLETPPYLRRHLFPMHPDLKLAGALPSLDMPHHLRKHEWCQYREGVTMCEIPHSKERRKMWRTPPGHTYVDTGLSTRVFIPAGVPPNTRVTIKFKDAEEPSDIPGNELLASAVSPTAPREENGYYWGYSIRSASSLSAVLTECPFDGGYDLTFGTSERGRPLSAFNHSKSKEQSVPDFRHIMIIFGGVAGLEVAVQADQELQRLGVKNPEALLDHWVNLCPGQGSRTIRTEEAVWLGLMGLREIVLKKGKR